MSNGTTAETAPGPLAGIRVLEFSQIVSTPVCGMNLSDLGADAIKVEPPGGEQTRRPGGLIAHESQRFPAVTRGKRGLVAALQQQHGPAPRRRLGPQTEHELEPEEGWTDRHVAGRKGTPSK